jgi:hypothetical protein
MRQRSIACFGSDGTITDGFGVKHSVLIAVRCLCQVLIEINNLLSSTKKREKDT